MSRIVECVPNISEGRNRKIINTVADAIKNVSDKIQLLNIESGYDTNRTVITFVGEPEAVENAAFQCIKTSYELIDMSTHKGTHPRQGCTDVCPFIPISEVSMDECVNIAKRVGNRVGNELGLPVYLYGYSASNKERANLAFIRKGEYENLKGKLLTLPPDYGPHKFNNNVKKGGAINISARDYLIAYNINLNTRDPSLANDIAITIRESGRTNRDEKGESRNVPGLLKAVRAIGWYIDEYGIAQISINLLNYKVTPLYVLFETCVEQAEKLGIRVTGSELVGLVPKEAVLDTGKYFLKKAKSSLGVPERELIHIAVKSLGLADIFPFKIDEKIIEYTMKKKGKMCSMRLYDCINEIVKDSPRPLRRQRGSSSWER